MADEGKSKRAGADAKGATKAAAPPPRRAGFGGMLHLDREQQARLGLIAAVVGVLAIVAGVIGFGYWFSVIRPRNRAVLQFDDTKISYDAMKRRMGYEFFQNVNFQRTQQGAAALPEATYQTLLDELTKVKLAPDGLGVGASQDEFDKKLRSRIGVADAADRRTFNDQFRSALDTAGLTENEFRRLVLAELLDTKIRDKFKLESPAQVTMVKYDVIAAASKDDADKAIARLNAGEDFPTVAKAVSRETSAATNGGLHDYEPEGRANPSYSGYLFSTNDFNKLSPPLQGNGTNPSFYVIKVEDRSPQPVKDTDKATIADKQLTDWLKQKQDELAGQGRIKRNWDNQSEGNALAAVLANVAPRKAAQDKKKLDDQKKAGEVRQTTVAELTVRPQTVAAGGGTPAPGGTAAPAGTPASDGTPAPGDTPASDATPAAGASPPAQGSSGTPAAPVQPVAPGNNGQ